MTASQSPSLMLNNIRSRVMPALFTTMLSPQTVGAGHQLVGGGTQAYVTGDRDALGARTRDLVEDVGRFECGGNVVDNDRRARAGQSDGLGTAQAAAAPVTTATWPERSVCSPD